MARPPGLIRRGNCWGLRVRVPDRLREAIGKTEIWKSFGPVSYKEACREANSARVKVDRLFAEAEARARGIPPNQTPTSISLSESDIREIAYSFLTKLEAEANPIPMREQERLEDIRIAEEEASLIGQNIEDATVQLVAISAAADAGFSISRADDGFLAVVEAVQGAWIEFLQRRSERLRGHNVATIDPLYAGIDSQGAAIQSITLSRAIELYKSDPERLNVAPKTRKAWDFRFRAIEDLLGGNRRVNSFKREDMRQLRELLMALPANASKHFPNMPLAEAIRVGEERKLPTLSAKSVSLYLEALSSLFIWLEKEEHVSRNPAKRLKAPALPREKPRRPFTDDELRRVLVETWRSTRTWERWMPQIALASGLRLNEIAGLCVGDITELEGIWCFRVRPNVHRDLKTATSARDVPIHPILLKKGITQLLADAPVERLLFTDLPGGAGSNAVQKALGRKVREIVPDPKATFHSFRHNFRDAMVDANIPSDIQEKLGGWKNANQSAMQGYGRGAGITTLADWIRRCDFPALEGP